MMSLKLIARHKLSWPQRQIKLSLYKAWYRTLKRYAIISHLSSVLLLSELGLIDLAIRVSTVCLGANHKLRRKEVDPYHTQEIQKRRSLLNTSNNEVTTYEPWIHVKKRNNERIEIAS